MTDEVRSKGDNADVLPSGAFDQPPSETTKIKLGIDIVSHRLVFTMEHQCGVQSAGQSTEDGHFLLVEEGKFVAFEISLDPNWQWKFDCDPITFKTKKHAKYYQLKESGEKKILLWVKSTKSHKNDPDNEDSGSHKFNIYLVMDQTSKIGFPVRLDPDLKNPPPPPGLYQPAIGPVPIV